MGSDWDSFIGVDSGDDPTLVWVGTSMPILVWVVKMMPILVWLTKMMPIVVWVTMVMNFDGCLF